MVDNIAGIGLLGVKMKWKRG